MSKKFLIISLIIGAILIGIIVFIIIYSPQKDGGAPSSIIKKTFPFLFPSSGEENATPSSSQSSSPTTIQAEQQKKIARLTQKAISGAVFFEEKNQGAIVEKIRYFEKATGNIYDINLQTNTAERISNTTIPNIFEVHWSPGAGKAVVRYIEKNDSGIEDIVRNFAVLNIGATSTQGVFLPSAITTITSSPEEDKIFYMASYENTNIGLVSNFENKNQKQIFSISFGEFLAFWPNKNTATLLSKPAAEVGGFFYKLNLATNSLEKILSGISGLTALMSYNGEKIIYSGSGYRGAKAALYTLKDKKTSVFDLDIVPEKCAWSRIYNELIYCAVPSNLDQGKFPDDWYQGIISFSDRIWKIDTKNGATEIITSESDYDFDAINLFLSKNEGHLFFQNKKDGTLWSVKLLP